jgi:periplasmic divalent cation tolerance protein
MATDVVLLLSTFPSRDVARTVTFTLVEECFVACGSVVPGVESIYRWKGEIETSDEVLVIFKTTAGRAAGAMERLRALHPYEVPEIVQIPIADGWPDYLAWVGESVSMK